VPASSGVVTCGGIWNLVLGICQLHSFSVELVGPLDVAASVEGFRRWGDDFIDHWDGRTLVRVLHATQRAVAYAVQTVGSISQPELRIEVADADDELPVAAAVRGMFVQAPAEALDRLVAEDRVVAELEGRYPGLRPALERHPLTALVRSISAQQVNLRWAVETRRRLVTAFGQRHQIGQYEVGASVRSGWPTRKWPTSEPCSSRLAKRSTLWALPGGCWAIRWALPSSTRCPTTRSCAG